MCKIQPARNTLGPSCPASGGSRPFARSCLTQMRGRLWMSAIPHMRYCSCSGVQSERAVGADISACVPWSCLPAAAGGTGDEGSKFSIARFEQWLSGHGCTHVSTADVSLHHAQPAPMASSPLLYITTVITFPFFRRHPCITLSCSAFAFSSNCGTPPSQGAFSR